ncbi:MAG: DUF4232 domain-containing protein [Vulcanimicrobiaceae bacterium]
MILAGLALAAAPICSSAQIRAVIAGVNHGAGRAQTTILLANSSDQRCRLPAYPTVTFLRQGRTVHVKIGRGRDGAPVIVRRRSAAALTFGWSDLGPAGGDCPTVADALVGWPGAGIPLWVPVAVDACMAMRQSPLAPAAAPASIDTTAATGFDRWLNAAPCEAPLLRLSTIRRAWRPLVHDALRIDFVNRHTARPIFFDPTHGILAKALHDSVQSLTLCGRNHSVPYGIPYADLAPASTTRGVHLGMTPDAVERIEGPAQSVSLGGGFSALHYRWSAAHGAPPAHGEPATFNLNLLFYRLHLMAIDYSTGPLR